MLSTSTACSNANDVPVANPVQDANCTQTGFTPRYVCRISHFQALGSDRYLDDVVRISGFVLDINVGGHRDRLLFLSEEQASMPNIGGAIRVGEFSTEGKRNRLDAYRQILETNIGKPVEIVGTLRRNPNPGLNAPSHMIDDIVGVNALKLTDVVVREEKVPSK